MPKSFRLLNHISIVLCLLLISILCTVLTIFLAQSYSTQYWQIIDLTISTMAISIRSSLLTTIMLGLTHFGYWGVIIWWSILILFLIKQKKRAHVLITVATALLSLVIGLTVKQIIYRPRPVIESILIEQGYSFPSMHTLMSTSLCILTGYVFFSLSRSYVLSLLVQILLYFICLGIGYSRIYLGVHHLSDVFAGFFMAVGIVSFVLASAKGIWILNLYAKKNLWRHS